MTMQLRGRPKRYSQTTDELCRRAEGVPFHHVGWDGRRRSGNLVRHAEVAAERLSESQSVGNAGELLSTFPGLESLELLHVLSIRGSMLFSRTECVHGMHKSMRAIPDSLVPVVL